MDALLPIINEPLLKLMLLQSSVMIMRIGMGSPLSNGCYYYSNGCISQ